VNNGPVPAVQTFAPAGQTAGCGATISGPSTDDTSSALNKFVQRRELERWVREHPLPPEPDTDADGNPIRGVVIAFAIMVPVWSALAVWWFW
jgi:hypothetical protein